MRILPAVAALGLLLAPELAQACPVCSPGSDESRLAFLLTTIFMSALPLALIGGAMLWLWRRSTRLGGAERPVRPVGPAPTLRSVEGPRG